MYRFIQINTSAMENHTLGIDFTVVNFFLILITVYLGIQAHIFQIRTSLRESLEQLDPLDVQKGPTLNPLLHEFNYGFPIIGRFLKIASPSVTIKIRNTPPGGDSPVATRLRKWSDFAYVDIDKIEKRLNSLEGLEAVEIDTRELRFNIRSRNPVIVRKRTVDAMLQIEDSVNEEWES